MMPPFPSLTAECHNDTFPAIDSKRPELSAKGKKVVISGGGAGIGRDIAQASALAGASSITILGQRQALLEETKEILHRESSDSKVSIHVTDVVDSVSVEQAAREIREWDVLVSNAGFLASQATLVEAEEKDWSRGFEVNVKGSFNLSRAFLSNRSKDAKVISVNAGSTQVPGPFSARNSSYNSSKFASSTIFETLAVENPDVYVMSMHPGVVDTDMMRKLDVPRVSIDTMELSSHFAVWLSSPEARFLLGRFVWANWDVEQLLAKKGEIVNSLLLTANVLGWPYSP